MKRWLRNAWDWCAEHDKELSTVLLIISLFFAIWSVWKVQAAGAEIAHDDKVDDLEFQRDVAILCEREWTNYDEAHALYTDIPEGLIAFSQQRGGPPPNPEDVEAIRQVYAELFAERRTEPSCDRESARTMRDISERELAELRGE